MEHNIIAMRSVARGWEFICECGEHYTDFVIENDCPKKRIENKVVEYE